MPVNEQTATVAGDGPNETNRDVTAPPWAQPAAAPPKPESAATTALAPVAVVAGETLEAAPSAEEMAAAAPTAATDGAARAGTPEDDYAAIVAAAPLATVAPFVARDERTDPRRSGGKVRLLLAERREARLVLTIRDVDGEQRDVEITPDEADRLADVLKGNARQARKYAVVVAKADAEAAEKRAAVLKRNGFA